MHHGSRGCDLDPLERPLRHYVTDSIVFSSLTGLDVAGAANMIDGLHVWFPGTPIGRNRIPRYWIA